MGEQRVEMPRTLVDLSLDQVDSRGASVLPLDHSTARPSAVSMEGGVTWYGFVLNDSAVDTVHPGQTVRCWISFFNEIDSKVAFPVGSSAVFGDGVATRGVIRIRSAGQVESG